MHAHASAAHNASHPEKCRLSVVFSEPKADGSGPREKPQCKSDLRGNSRADTAQELVVQRITD